MDKTWKAIREGYENNAGAEGETKGIANAICALMKNKEWSAEKSMDALDIPAEEREQYLKMMNACVRAG